MIKKICVHQPLANFYCNFLSLWVSPKNIFKTFKLEGAEGAAALLTDAGGGDTVYE